MLEVVHGQTKNQPIAEQLIQQLGALQLDGTLYVGYPVLSTADDRVEVDALLVSREHGLIAFLFGTQPDDQPGWQLLKDAQDRLYFAIQNNLSKHDELRRGRSLPFEILTVTILPEAVVYPAGDATFKGMSEIGEFVKGVQSVDQDTFKKLEAALQRVSTIKPHKKRDAVTSPTSKAAILKVIEKSIATLDQWQKKAAIESPEAPQRIRGLAGSGKTVVLALKAAYLHAQHPEWNIAVTYYSRALKQQLKDLIRRFCFEHLGDEPDWDRLQVLHSWGSSGEPGVYSQIADALEVLPRDFGYAKVRYGMDGGFEGICRELISIASNSQAEPIYDAVLIDEAQDLPPVFFQLVHRFTRDPKRIAWAYDELQKLSEAVMPSTSELFGQDESGAPKVVLHNADGAPRQDIVLPVCYRNPPWALTVAHGVGFGLKRLGGIVQHFDDPSMWEEVGYQVVDGSLQAGQGVTIERSLVSSPDYFRRLLSPEDSLVLREFETEDDQAEWLAEEIEKNLSVDELEHDDILVVLPDAYRAKRRAPRLQIALSRRNIVSHVVGVTSSRDEVFRRGSIAIAHIYRSKGNEAPMVYALDCQECFTGHELIKLRNILFTAITRSRAWVRLSGIGPGMAGLISEIDAIRTDNYRLRFRVPTLEQLRQTRIINRDRTAEEKAKIRKLEKGVGEFFEAVRKGEISVHSLPPETRVLLEKILRLERDEDELN